MLPDYPDLKTKLHQELMVRFSARVDQMAPLMARIRRYRQAEGDKFVFEDEEGSVIKKGFHRFERRIEIPSSLPPRETAKAVDDQPKRRQKLWQRNLRGCYLRLPRKPVNPRETQLTPGENRSIFQ